MNKYQVEYRTGDLPPGIEIARVEITADGFILKGGAVTFYRGEDSDREFVAVFFNVVSVVLQPPPEVAAKLENDKLFSTGPKAPIKMAPKIPMTKRY